MKEKGRLFMKRHAVCNALQGHPRSVMLVGYERAMRLPVSDR